VWWVGKQMRLEREHCCDDMAVAVCGSVLEYANALAEMEEIRGRNMEPAMAANGGELLRRIRRLLRQPEPPSQSAMLAVVLALLIAGAAAIVSLRAAPQEAQHPALSQPAFDVASIRPTPAGIDPGPRFGLGPRTHVESATLKGLVMLAYDVKDFQVSGGPGWTNSDRYDIDATVEGESRGTGPAYRTLVLRRLQTLLRDRFKLAVHRETKELPIYELVVAKGGFKLQPVKEGSCVPFDAEKFRAPGSNPMDFCGYGGFGRGFYEASTVSMADLAYALPMVVGRTVVDKTGITGIFRIHLTYQFVSPPAGPPDAARDPAPADDAGLSIFTALQEQLGLKLESSKGPVEVLVIDHVEKPSEN
jgi:bla regulator protein blaR1